MVTIRRVISQFWRDGWARIARSFRGLDRLRLAVEVEVGAVLLFGVALTIMPQTTLGWLHAATTWLRDLGLSYRPVVAFVGLVLVIASLWGLVALMRRPRNRELGAVEVPESGVR